MDKKKKIKKTILLYLFFLVILASVGFSYGQTDLLQEEDTEIEIPELISVTDIDYDFQTTMYVGDNQLIIATPLPAAASYDEIIYTSSNSEVATVNQAGRIRAVAIGRTIIGISAGGITKYEMLTVTTNSIPVTDLDIGDYEYKIEVGNTQLISASVLPVDATNQKIYYTSSDSRIATVNQAGRVTGIHPGVVTIGISCEGITRKIEIEIIEEKKITEIDIGECEKKMKVGDKQNIQVTLYPTDVKNQSVSYTSSDNNVLKVSSSGQITAVGKGNASIIITAGIAKEEIEIEVKEKTERIALNTYYKTMKPGQSFQLEAQIYPSKAEQNLTFESTNTNVAAVNANGNVKAKGEGHASIIVTNDDLTQIVIIIVNSTGKSAADYTALSEEERDKLVVSSPETIKISGSQCRMITERTLSTLARTKGTIIVGYDNYELYLDGDDIKNTSNILLTDIKKEKVGENITFEINEGKALPGTFSLILKSQAPQYEFLYLFNDEKGKYQRLKYEKGNNTIPISEAGRYLLTNEKQAVYEINTHFIFGVTLVGTVLVGAYIFTKRKYWFW